MDVFWMCYNFFSRNVHFTNFCKEVIFINIDLLTQSRNSLTNLIQELQELADTRPENGAEITIAIRHLQDARMRLGVAKTIANGEDPWAEDVL